MQKRIEKLQARFDDLGVDAILITSRSNHRYFTKFDNEDGFLFITRDKAFAYEDFRYVEIAQKLLSPVYTVYQSFPMKDIVNDLKIKSIGIEGQYMSLNTYNKYKAMLEGVCFVDVSDAISLLRQVKDEWEIEQIRQAQIITDLAFEHILGYLSTDVTENDVATELEYFMRRHGAEDKSFETISISAEKTSLPHGVPADIKLKKGFFTMDFGATVNGYHSDMTRTVCIGKADDEMKKLYNTVLKAQLAGLDYLRAGVSCYDADRIAREIIDVDYKGLFGHSLGHSVGLDIHESPALSPKSDKILVCGNVVTVEPGIYVVGRYGCRIEDLVVIRENGIENLTKSPKALIEL
ncbi:MAG: aminopeptidase P family protein [Clostridia bacterium]|nr:aminopeptidase P family protein [Clostridia bacterium]